MSGGIYCEKQKGSFQKNNRFFNGMLYADNLAVPVSFAKKQKKSNVYEDGFIH